MKNLKIGIIGGKGKMGAYFALFFKKQGYKVVVADIGTKMSNLELAKQCDVVVVSVPIEHTLQVIQEVAPHVKKEALLMDLTSVKSEPVEEMLKSEASVVGCHPMFAPTVSLKNQIIILSRARGTKWYNWLRNLFKNAGAHVKELEPEKHDELMTVIQSLTHFTDITLAHSLTKSDIPIRSFLEYQSPAYRLKLNMMGRILNQDASLYGNMQIQNSKTLPVLKTYLKSVKTLIKIVKKKKLDKFVDYFEEGADYLGNFKEKAQKESDLLIEFLNQGQSSDASRQSPDLSLKGKEIATLGPANSFSDLTTKQYAPKAEIYYARTIREVFDLVKAGKIKTGIVPIENKIEGSVRETMDLLFETDLKITQKIVFPIKHCLAVLPETLKKDVEVILSHAQPLGQCAKFIKRNYAQAETLATSSTSEAMHQLQSKNLKNAAAIGSEESAKNLGLRIIARNIGDEKSNETHFYVVEKADTSCQLPVARNIIHLEGDQGGVVAKKDSSHELRATSKKLPTTDYRLQTNTSKESTYRTSIAFYFGEDTHGTLLSVLQEFNKSKVNLTRIESRPAGKKMGNYIFYLDFEGEMGMKKVQNVLERIEKKVDQLKNFGSYEMLSF